MDHNNNRQVTSNPPGVFKKLWHLEGHADASSFDQFLICLHKGYILYQVSSCEISIYHVQTKKVSNLKTGGKLVNYLILPPIKNKTGFLFTLILLCENNTLLIYKMLEDPTEDSPLRDILIKEKVLGNGAQSEYFGLAQVYGGFIVLGKKEFTLCGLSNTSFKTRTKTLPEISAGQYEVISCSVNTRKDEVMLFLSNEEASKLLSLSLKEGAGLAKTEFVEIESENDVELVERDLFLAMGSVDLAGESATKFFLAARAGTREHDIKFFKFHVDPARKVRGRSKRVLVLEGEYRLDLETPYVCSFTERQAIIWGSQEIKRYDLEASGTLFENPAIIDYATIVHEDKKCGVEVAYDWAEMLEDGNLLLANNEMVGIVYLDDEDRKLALEKEARKAKEKKKTATKVSGKPEAAKKNGSFSRSEEKETEMTKASVKKAAEFRPSKNKSPVKKKTEMETEVKKLTGKKETKKNLIEEGNKFDERIEKVIAKVKKQQKDLQDIEKELSVLLLKGGGDRNQ